MAHGNHGGGAGGGAGIEGIAPPTGASAAALGLGGFIAAIWMIVKHPAVAKKCLIAALVFTALFAGTNILDNPLVGMLGLFVGACMVGKP